MFLWDDNCILICFYCSDWKDSAFHHILYLRQKVRCKLWLFWLCKWRQNTDEVCSKKLWHRRHCEQADKTEKIGWLTHNIWKKWKQALFQRSFTGRLYGQLHLERLGLQNWVRYKIMMSLLPPQSQPRSFVEERPWQELVTRDLLKSSRLLIDDGDVDKYLIFIL